MSFNPRNANGQAASAASAPVVLASDQSAIPVTNTGLSNIPAKGAANTAGALPVSIATDQAAIPVALSGVSTAAKQDTGNTSLASLDTKLPAKGSAASAASVPVVVASDQAAIPVSATGLSRIPAQGAAASAASLPVVVASDQILPVSLSNMLSVNSGAVTPAINVDLLSGTTSGWFDAAAYHSVSIMLQTSAGISAGTIQFEQTNDTTAAPSGISLYGQDMGTSAQTLANNAVLSASLTKVYNFPVVMRYIRARASVAVAGGTVQAVATFSQVPWISNTLTVNPGNSVNTTAWLANPLTPAVSTTGDTGTKTASFNGATITNASSKGASVLFNVGAVSGTSPTMVCKLQGSSDGGTNWYDLPGATTAAITATGQYGVQIYPGLATVAGVATSNTTATASGLLPRSWRAVYTLGGTSPSFAITAVQVSYSI